VVCTSHSVRNSHWQFGFFFFHLLFIIYYIETYLSLSTVSSKSYQMARIKNVPRKSNEAVSRKVSPIPKTKTKQKSLTSFGIPHLKALKNHHARNIPHAPGVAHLK
jgi:hypothetical protein